MFKAYKAWRKRVEKRKNICYSAMFEFEQNKRMALRFNTAQVLGDKLHQAFLDKASTARKTHNENRFWYMKEL